MPHARNLTLTVLAGLALPAVVHAQSREPRLIQPPSFGIVREVLGNTLPIVTAKPTCKTPAGGVCLDGLPLGDAPLRVVALTVPARPGDRVTGAYGQTFTLYDVRRGPKGAEARALALPTSAIQVPRNCYALAGEDVAYGIGRGGDTATESQYVSCDGGPRQPHGPYAAEGPVIRSSPGGQGAWHATEMQRVAGQPRYLAAPGNCDPQYSVRTTWCALPAVTWLQTHPGEDELDLIAAHGPVRPSDVLTDKDLDQWVLKRKGDNKFKADGRWFKKSLMATVDGCTPVEDVRWYVEAGGVKADEAGPSITEKALSRCGAPLAPVPSATYEAYGDDLFVIDCADHRGWRDRDEKSPDGCFDQARDFLHHTHQKSAYFVVLNQHAHRDDRLYDGGYLAYDVTEVKLNKDDTMNVHRQGSYTPDVSLPNCAPVANGPKESQGFLIADGGGIRMARPFRWMSCPAY